MSSSPLIAPSINVLPQTIQERESAEYRNMLRNGRRTALYAELQTSQSKVFGGARGGAGLDCRLLVVIELGGHNAAEGIVAIMIDISLAENEKCANTDT